MDAMEQIWEKVAALNEQGKKVILYKNVSDLVFLYANGFVDTLQYKLEEWVQAFQDSQQKDGSFRITRPQWLAKKKYRYDGLVEKPFDPWQIKEREYSEKEFGVMLRAFIVPSTWLTPEAVPQVIANYKSHGKFKDGKILVNEEIRQDFARMLRLYPSPLRNLQISVHGLPRGVKQWSDQRSTQTSKFTQESDAGREAAKKLDALFQSPLPQVAGSEASNATTTSLKDLMKKKRPPAGRV